ncbi:MAG: hypothetical protein SFX74_01380 [Fimbriimonadaceae bacterium]|nr:hypothetical protein [Fimbriimonadaceae bacterium]
MTDTQRELWNRIDAFRIGPQGVADTFARRLAREQGWSLAFADRVIAEYKRFVFLCMEAGEVCTPSVAVDEAWHLHLTYTRSYWDDMCGTILDRPLHHDPSAGGNQQAEYFWDRYEQTKRNYTRFFGETPPADIWPSATERFAPRRPADPAAYPPTAPFSSTGPAMAPASGRTSTARRLAHPTALLAVGAPIALTLLAISNLPSEGIAVGALGIGGLVIGWIVWMSSRAQSRPVGGPSHSTTDSGHTAFHAGHYAHGGEYLHGSESHHRSHDPTIEAGAIDGATEGNASDGGGADAGASDGGGSSDGGGGCGGGGCGGGGCGSG